MLQKGDDARSIALITQYGALPYRIDAEGVLEILLITSRETARWVIPKGHPVPGLAPPQSAALEAYEEAGIEGEVAEAAIGVFRYRKRIRFGLPRLVRVTVFPLRVTRVLRRWPEAHQRRRQWLPRAAAASAVQEVALRRLILAFRP